MPFYFVVVKRNSQPRCAWNLDVALVDDRLVDSSDEILPEGYIERMVLEREEVACRRRAMNVRHTADRCTGEMHRHWHAIAEGHVADLVRAQDAARGREIRMDLI